MKPSAPIANPSWLLLYDDECMLCRTLAGAIESQKIQTKPWQAHAPQSFHEIKHDIQDIGLIPVNPRTLEPENEALRTGPEAWEILIAVQPQLQAWAWIAGRLGLSPQKSAKILQRGAHALRALCPKCPKRSLGSRTSTRSKDRPDVQFPSQTQPDKNGENP